MSTASITSRNIHDQDLPPAVTGVHWTDTGWTECRDHLLDPSWASAVPADDTPTGVALTGEVCCDACREVGR